MMTKKYYVSMYLLKGDEMTFSTDSLENAVGMFGQSIDLLHPCDLCSGETGEVLMSWRTDQAYIEPEMMVYLFENMIE